MGRLVTDLRKLADLETAALSLEDVDIAETVHDAAQAGGEEGTARGGAPRIRLDLPRVPWPLSHVRGDGDLLYSAVYNVISNASKYTSPGGTVEVRGREESGTVTIEVADTIGAGDTVVNGITGSVGLLPTLAAPARGARPPRGSAGRATSPRCASSPRPRGSRRWRMRSASARTSRW